MTTSRRSADRLLFAALGISAGTAGLLLGLMLLFLAIGSWPALHRLGVAPFFLDRVWMPAEGRFSLLPMAAASLAVAAGSFLITAPMALLTSIHIKLYAGRKTAVLAKRMVEILAGIPSVVFGLFGLTSLVPLIARFQPPGASLLAAVLVLSPMILPTMVMTTLAGLETAPESQIRAAAALGLSPFALFQSVLWPAARRSTLTGMLLGVSRAIGETMAVMMVAGNIVRFPSNPFLPIRTLTANIALQMSFAEGDHLAALFLSGLLLAILVLALLAAEKARGHKALVSAARSGRTGE